MANWYVSSVAYAAIAPWAASTAYTVGQIIRPTAAANGKSIAQRCTTAGTTGTTEPTWSLNYNTTTTSGTAIFTTINGNTYGWSGAAGDLTTVTNYSTAGFAAAGDQVFLSSDHAETGAPGNPFNYISGAWTTQSTLIISVNRAGSVPPVAADITTGASITFSGTLYVDAAPPLLIDGLKFTVTNSNIYFNSNQYQTQYLKNCSLVLTGTGAYTIIAGNPAKVVFDNTTVTFSAAGQYIGGNYPFELVWLNTPSAILGTAPTDLFKASGGQGFLATLRGVDLSGYAGVILLGGGGETLVKVLLEDCKVSASATLYSTGTAAGSMPLIELVNCFDGTKYRNERYQGQGAVTTERTIVLTGGATDDIGTFSLKMVSNSSKIDRFVNTLDTFYFDVENTSTGSAKTATVEIVSSSSLNNNDISLQIEYLGTAGSSLASFASSLPTTPLTTATAVTTSLAAWTSSPATPVYQKLQVSFTPQVAGRVRGIVKLGKASTTVYVNPVITIA